MTHVLQLDWLGVPFRLAHPERLWLTALALALAIVWAVGTVRRLRSAHRILGERALARALVGRSPGRIWTKGGSLTLGTLCLALALTQPQCGAHTELTKRTGIDVVVALDASRSMLAEDIRPSRLARAKLELSDLLDRLRGDRVGIVVFAADAFVQCPLTTDYAAAKLFLKAIDVGSVPQQGTSLSAALLTSKQLLDGGGGVSRGRAVVLLTDGEDHEKGIEDAAGQLADEGIRVYPVGIGSATGEPIPVYDDHGRFAGYKRDKLGQTVMTRLNEDVLREIAQKTQGRYFHSTAGDVGVPAVSEELERLDKAEFESHLTVQYAERFQAFAYPGFLLLLLGAALSERRREKKGVAR
ncbi:MAG: VWA domain-containing protein [Deltaproteobacteria bacterium]